MKTQVERSIFGRFRKRTSVVTAPTIIDSKIEKHSHMNVHIKTAIVVYPADAHGKATVDDQQFTWDADNSTWHNYPVLADVRKIVTPDCPYVHGLVRQTRVVVIPD